MEYTKKIQRTERIEFVVSKEEKDLIYEFARLTGKLPSALIRNIVLEQATGLLGKLNISVIRAYKKYLELTDPKLLEELLKEE